MICQPRIYDIYLFRQSDYGGDSNAYQYKCIIKRNQKHLFRGKVVLQPPDDKKCPEKQISQVTKIPGKHRQNRRLFVLENTLRFCHCRYIARAAAKKQKKQPHMSLGIVSTAFLLQKILAAHHTFFIQLLWLPKCIFNCFGFCLLPHLLSLNLIRHSCVYLAAAY